MFDGLVIMSGGHCSHPPGGQSFALNIKNFPERGFGFCAFTFWRYLHLWDDLWILIPYPSTLWYCESFFTFCHVFSLIIFLHIV